MTGRSEPVIEIPGWDGRTYRVHEITPGLMLSGRPFEASHVDAIADGGVAIVVNLCLPDEDFPPERMEVEDAMTRRSIREERLPLESYSPVPPEVFSRAADCADECARTGTDLLVHCNTGRQRSVVVVAGILVSRGLSTEAALAHITSSVEGADPTAAQTRSLAAWHDTPRQRSGPTIESTAAVFERRTPG